jgi:hypothetical protein
MDVNDRFFEETTAKRPFPDEDYHASGKLRNVRGRILKKLLKYEFKAYLKPMLIVLAALFALAISLCILGCFITPEEFNYETEEDPLRMIAWTIAMVVFVWAAMASVVLPIGFASKRYHKQFFTSEAYLTLSIPATPEEHILAKRIAAYVAILVGTLAAVLAAIISFLPIFGMLGTGEVMPPIDSSETIAVSGWDVLYVILEGILSPLFFLAICGAFLCWRHRGLKTWMIVLLAVGIYFLSTVLNIFLIGFILEIPPETWEILLEVGKWVGFVAKCVLLYLLFLYETQTLRKKINLK